MPGEERPPDSTAFPGRLHGRRKGKKLSARRSDLMARLLPVLRIDIDQPPPAHAADLFPVPVDLLRLEIGFGGGEHLISEAAAAPACVYRRRAIHKWPGDDVAAIADRGLASGCSMATRRGC
jgi:hypothetical protein